MAKPVAPKGFIPIPAAVARYDPYGPYLDYADAPALSTSPRIRFDANGIPKVSEPGGYVYNAVTIAQWGLRGESRWLVKHDAKGRRDADKASKWLLDHQGRDGAWRYAFPFSPAGISAPLPRGWASAMAQGQVMSLLTRVHRRTHRASLLRSAERGLAVLEVPVSRGGVAAPFRGYVFYEEYPTTPPSLALNGFMFTLIGLYDLSRAAPTSHAKRLFDRGMATLRWSLPLYDTQAKFSIYHLGYLTQPGQPPHQSLFYHGVHIHLLRALNHVAPAAVLRRYAARWNQYVAQPGDPQ